MNKKRINEFLKRLEGTEGCDFKEKVKGDTAFEHGNAKVDKIKIYQLKF